MIDERIEDIIVDRYECCYNGHECCMYVSIAFDKDEAEWEEPPFHMYVTLFGDFERNTYHTREDLERELREMDKRFDMYMNVEEILEAVDEYIATHPIEEEEEE